MRKSAAHPSFHSGNLHNGFSTPVLSASNSATVLEFECVSTVGCSRFWPGGRSFPVYLDERKNSCDSLLDYPCKSWQKQMVGCLGRLTELRKLVNEIQCSQKA